MPGVSGILPAGRIPVENLCTYRFLWCKFAICQCWVKNPDHTGVLRKFSIFDAMLTLESDPVGLEISLLAVFKYNYECILYKSKGSLVAFVLNLLYAVIFDQDKHVQYYSS